MIFYKGKTRGIEKKSVVVRIWGYREGLIAKGHKPTWGKDGTALYIDCSGSYITMYFSKLMESSSKNGELYSMEVVPQETWIKEKLIKKETWNNNIINPKKIRKGKRTDEINNLKTEAKWQT